MKLYAINLQSALEHMRQSLALWFLVVVKTHSSKEERDVLVQGTTRAPHWRGGGVVHGPHPRSHAK